MALICDKSSLFILLSIFIYCGNCAQLNQSSTDDHNLSSINTETVVTETSFTVANTDATINENNSLVDNRYNNKVVNGITANTSTDSDHNSTQLYDDTEESIDEGNYADYYMSDYCSGIGPELVYLNNGYEADSNTTSPAILHSHRNNTNLSNKTCAVGFRLPKSKWFRTYGLILSVQHINITNAKSACADYFDVGLNSSVDLRQLKRWCNNSDAIGHAFANSNYLDIVFHASDNSTTSFTLVITPYKGSIVDYCPFSSNFKCSGDGIQCISKKYQCDGINNCPTGNDENGCTITTTTSPPITTTSPPITTTTPPITTTSPPITTTAIIITTTTITPTTTTPTSTTTTTTTTTTTPRTTTTSTTTTTTAPTTTTKKTTTTAKPSSTTKSPDKGLSGGSIAGIVIGSIIGFLILIVVVFYTIKTCKNRSNRGYSPLNE